MDAFAAGRLSRTIDPLHSISYFVRDVAERFGALGMERRPRVDFGQHSRGVAVASPETVTAVRYEIIDAAGRPLYAAHAELPWPDSAHGQLWHAVTLLREYRGDGHIAALIANGLAGLEALVTHTVAGIGFSTQFARRLRGWSAEQWAAAADGLRARGLLDDTDTLTTAGVELRSRIEDLTDELAYGPWSTLSDEHAGQVAIVAKAVQSVVQAADLFPGARSARGTASTASRDRPRADGSRSPRRCRRALSER